MLLTRTIFWLLIALVCLAPLPFGADRPWASSLLGLWVGLMLVVWALDVARRRDPAVVTGRSDLAIAAVFGLLVLWLLVQVSPQTPAAWHHPAWDQAATALGAAPRGAIALAPERGTMALMRMVGYAGVFWLALHYGAREADARIMAWSIALAGFAYAAYGLVMVLGGYELILWYPKWTFRGYVTGTFVARATYATYAGLGLVATLVLLLDALRRIGGAGTPRATLVHLADAGLAPWLLGAALATLGTALLLAGSRGGVIAAAAGVIAALASFAMTRLARRRGWMTGSVAIVLAGLLLLGFSGQTVMKRFTAFAEPSPEAAESGDFGRAAVFELTARSLSKRPLAGGGLGSFPGIFFADRDAGFGASPKTYRRVHNSYLELALEMGLPAFVVLQLLLASLLALCLRGVVVRRRAVHYPCMGVAATVLVAVHSLVDFSLQVPGVAVTYFCLMGVAVAQSRRSPNRPRPGRSAPEDPVGGPTGRAPNGDRPDRAGAP